MRRTALAIVVVGAFTFVGQAWEHPGTEAAARPSVNLAELPVGSDSTGVPVTVSFRYPLPEARVAALLGPTRAQVHRVGVGLVGIRLDVATAGDALTPSAAMRHARTRATEVLDSIGARVGPRCDHGADDASDRRDRLEATTPSHLTPSDPPLRRVERSIALLRGGGAFVDRVEAVVPAKVVTALASDRAVREVRAATAAADTHGPHGMMAAEAIGHSCRTTAHGSG